MCTECNLYFVVHIEPFGMMIHFLGLQSNTCHESKRFVEIFEKELLVNSVPVFHFCPPGLAQGRKSRVSFFFVEFLAFWCWHDGKRYWRSSQTTTCSTIERVNENVTQAGRGKSGIYLCFLLRSIFYAKCIWRYTRATITLQLLHLRKQLNAMSKIVQTTFDICKRRNSVSHYPPHPRKEKMLLVPDE